jgi:beta-lactamase class D
MVVLTIACFLPFAPFVQGRSVVPFYADTTQKTSEETSLRAPSSTSSTSASSVATIPAGVESFRWEKIFKAADGTPVGTAFVLYNARTGRFTRYNEARCQQQMSPFGLFMIPAAIIGLETGAIPDTSTVINWNRKKYPAQEFWQREMPHWMDNQTLRSALRGSVDWYFRELTARINEGKWVQYLKLFGYGNADASGGTYRAQSGYGDIFWLGSSLRVSAEEQIVFLQRLHNRKLPVSGVYMTMVQDMITVEETQAYRLWMKTGGGANKETGKFLGWCIGIIEITPPTGDNTVYYFALNCDAGTAAVMRDRRVNFTRQALKALNILP